MEEKRKFMRFNVLLDALCRTGGALKKLKVSNFSREGLGVVAEDNLPGGKEVEIELQIPGDNIPVVVSGQIAWTSRSEKKKRLFNGGIRLIGMDSADRGRILNYIYSKWMLSKDGK